MMEMHPEEIKHVVFEPSAKQWEAFTTEANAVLYGGAAGGGKSWFAKWCPTTICTLLPNINCYIVRRNYNDLKDNYLLGEQSLEVMLTDLIDDGIVTYNKSDKLFQWSNGSFIRLFASDHERDIEKHFRGKEIHLLLCDEATLFTPHQINYMSTRLRMSHDTKMGLLRYLEDHSDSLPDELLDIDWGSYFPRAYYLTNPTGPSHGYFKNRFYDNKIPHKIYETTKKWKGKTLQGWKEQFIPAFISDNPRLDQAAYAAALISSGTSNASALLDGDWSVNESGMFTDIFKRADHVIELPEGIPFIPPPHWKKWTALDWGSSEPYCELWLTESNGEDDIFGTIYERGTYIVFMENYGISYDDEGNFLHNRGVKFSPTEAAEIFNHIEKIRQIERISWHFAGMDLWSKQKINNTEYTRAQEFAENGRHYIQAAQGPGSRVHGWEMIRSLMIQRSNAGHPKLLFTENCVHLIRTLVDITRDPRPGYQDDTDPACEDHAPDALRYGLSPNFKGKELPSPQYLQKQREEEQKKLKIAYKTYNDPLNQDKPKRKRRSTWDNRRS